MSKLDEGARRPIVISQGEPSGIGPEVAVKAFAALGGQIRGRPLRLIGSTGIFERAAAISGVDARGLERAIIDSGHAAAKADPGRPSVENAPGVIAAIAQGVQACERKEAAALVTAPIQKAVMTESGFGFPGHTEFLAELAASGGKTPQPVMMLWSPHLAVVPVTIHLALREAIALLSTDLIVSTGRIVASEMKRRFGLVRPRLAVTGLNPHAGEDGTLGTEDKTMIAAAVEALRADGVDARGPLPADTLFHEAARKTYDCALCMYHDQALIPIKTLAFDEAVNVTLGLPFIRTSPDHGTAFDIAGTGRANPASLIAALRLAARMASAPAQPGS